MIELEDGIVEVKGVDGRPIGGIDIDSILVQYCAEAFKNQTGYDISHDAVARERLSLQCEKAKIELSSVFQADIKVELLAAGKDFKTTLTRSKFE